MSKPRGSVTTCPHCGARVPVTTDAGRWGGCCPTALNARLAFLARELDAGRLPERGNKPMPGADVTVNPYTGEVLR